MLYILGRKAVATKTAKVGDVIRCTRTWDTLATAGEKYVVFEVSETYNVTHYLILADNQQKHWMWSKRFEPIDE